MSKINSIEISDFRVYQDKQVFDFVYKGILSNLIVIYAPNGYGKTSFFDAVEWGLSGKIKRFEKDLLHDEITGNNFAKGDQILLTNRKSFLAGKKGVIKILAADGKFLRREVVLRKISKQSEKFDYKHNLLTGDYNQKIIGRISNTNILTQDQIDAFLRYTSPEDRFKALSEFWPEGREATLTYKYLNGYIRVIENDMAMNNNRIGEIRKAVKAYLNTDQHISRINESIGWLKENSVLDFGLEPVTAPVDQAVYESLNEAAASYLKNGERLLDSNQTLRNRLNSLIEQHPVYTKAIEDLAKAKAGLRKLEGLERLYVDLRNVTKSYTDRNNTLLDRQSDLTAYINLVGLMDNYSATRRNINEQETQVRALLEQNNQDLEKLPVHRRFLAALNKSYDELKVKITALQDTISTLSENYDLFTYWNREKERDQAVLKGIEAQIAEKEQLIGRTQERRRYLAALTQTDDGRDFNEADRLALQETLQNQASLTTTLNEVNTLLQQQQEAAKRSGSLDENLDRIITWGEEYVTALDADHCPLCKTEFSSVSELLAQIRAEKVSVLKVTQQQESITALTERRNTLTEQLKGLRETMNSYVAAEMTAANQLSQARQAEKDLLTGQRMDLVQSVRHAGDQAQQLFNAISVHLRLDQDITEQGPEEIKATLQADLEDLQIKNAKFEKLIAFKTELFQGLENVIAARKNQVVTLQNSVARLQADQNYINANRLLTQLKVTPKEMDKQLLTHRLDTLRSEVQEMEKEVAGQRSRRDKLQIEIARHELKWRDEEIAGKKLELERLIKSCNELIAQFEDTYYNTIQAEAISLPIILEAQKTLEERTSKLNAEIKRLQDFSIEIELINENIKKANLEKELDEINAKLPKLESARMQLADARKLAEGYIDSQVDSYFNKNVINQIYSRIEPHPELNHVDFIPKISHNGASLSVRASGFGDDLNPVLFLSAGQLNVLSLSIFLAKAFESGSDVLSTIFMDDPVQNLSDINILSFLDLIRSMVTTYNKQLVISTHDEHFYKLIQHKLPAADFNASYIELADFGRIKTDLTN